MNISVFSTFFEKQHILSESQNIIGCEKSMKNRRVETADIARGIAALSVILGHLGIWNINRIVYTFHVPLFFLITGYFMDNRRNVSDFIKRKARSLLVPYYLTCLVIILISAFSGLKENRFFYNFAYWMYASAYGAGDSYTEPFLIIGIGAIWFLWASFWGSLFLRISLEFSKKQRICWIGLLFVLGYYSSKLIWLPFSIQAGFCSTLFMYIGYLFGIYKKRIAELPLNLKKAGAIVIWIIWFVFIGTFQSFWVVHCDFGRGITDIIGCICACTAVMMIADYICQKTYYSRKLLSDLGRNSLWILCIHVVEMNLIPWRRLAAMTGFSASVQLFFIILCKLLLDCSGALFMSRMKQIKKLSV